MVFKFKIGLEMKQAKNEQVPLTLKTCSSNTGREKLLTTKLNYSIKYRTYAISYVVCNSHYIHSIVPYVHKKQFVNCSRPVSRPSSMLPFKDDCLIREFCNISKCVKKRNPSTFPYNTSSLSKLYSCFGNKNSHNFCKYTFKISVQHCQ